MGPSYRMGKVSYKCLTHVVGKSCHPRSSEEPLDEVLAKLLNKAKSSGKLDIILDLKFEQMAMKAQREYLVQVGYPGYMTKLCA